VIGFCRLESEEKFFLLNQAAPVLPLSRRCPVPSKANRILGAVHASLRSLMLPKTFRRLLSTQFWWVKMLNLAHATKKANEILKKIQNFQIIVRQEF